MKIFNFLLSVFTVVILYSCTSKPNSSDQNNLNILVLTERGGQHGPFTDAGLKWLDEESKLHHYAITEVNNTDSISDEFLSRYDLIIQLDFPPYSWTEEAEQAFMRYIDSGLGGWVGFHHATLLGEFDGYSMWQWFSEFMGNIRFQNYIAPLASGTVHVEDTTHPVMKDVPQTFVIPDDEWYTFNVSPRSNVHVIASVDEDSYDPTSEIKMGDHPVIWTNESKKSRNVYFLIGHSPKLYDTIEFTTMFRNAIFWVSQRD